MTSISDVLVHVLRAHGVKRLYGLPGGGTSSDLVRACAAGGVEFVLTHSESAAGYMASATYEIDRTPGVFCCSLGPGLASSINAMAHALLDRTGVVLVADAHADTTDTIHQRLPHEFLMRPVTKLSARVHAKHSTQIFHRAVAIAMAQPAGPVHLDLPIDVARAPMPAGFDRRPPEPALLTLPDPEALRHVARLLSTMQRPIALIGLGANRPGVSPCLSSFLQTHNIPYMHTYKAKGAAPESNELYCGIFVMGEVEKSLIEQADLVLAIGLDPVELLPGAWPYQKPVVYLGDSPHIPYVYPVHTQLTGALEHTLCELSSMLDWHTSWGTGSIARFHRENLDRLRGTSTAHGLAPGRTVEILAQECLSDTCVSVDAGAHMFAATSFWTSDVPRHFLISNGLATMGYAVPAAIAAALRYPNAPSMALVGDGGMEMSLAELETAVRLNAKVTIVVFDDSALSLIKVKQELQGEPPRGVDFKPVDFAAIAAGFGIPSWTVGTEQELMEAVTAAHVVSKGPSLIHVRIDPSGYQEMYTVLRGRA